MIPGSATPSKGEKEEEKRKGAKKIIRWDGEPKNKKIVPQESPMGG